MDELSLMSDYQLKQLQRDLSRYIERALDMYPDLKNREKRLNACREELDRRTRVPTNDLGSS